MIAFTVDMAPPVDPKFGKEMEERLDCMTTEQVLDVYVANMVAAHQNSIELALAIMNRNTRVDRSAGSNYRGLVGVGVWSMRRVMEVRRRI